MRSALPETRSLRAGTRGSRLARWQTALVARALLERAGCASYEFLVETEGDRDRETPLPAFGGAGVFTGALERELLRGTIDYAVHSLKDVPVTPTPGLQLAAIAFRDAPEDLLLSRDRWSLRSVPALARIGTCSVRRSAQLLAIRPDLRMLPLRGNIDTRVEKLRAGEFDAIVLASAGVSRLGLGRGISVPLPLDQVLPAPGQGALAIQCREGDDEVGAALAILDEPAVREATAAERGFLEGLGGGCFAPIAAHGTVDEGKLILRGAVLSADGGRVIRLERTGIAREGRQVGLAMAEEAMGCGAGELLR